MIDVNKIAGLSPVAFLNYLTENEELEARLPVNINKILEILNITKLKDDSIAKSTNGKVDLDSIGCIFYKKGESTPTIWLNPYEHHYETRERFTVAHELGHYVKHILPNGNEKMFVDNDRTLSRSRSYGDRVEFEANKFAAIMLMPKGLVTKSFKNYQNEGWLAEDLIERVARDFNVSRQAMRYRLANLDLLYL